MLKGIKKIVFIESRGIYLCKVSNLFLGAAHMERCIRGSFLGAWYELNSTRIFKYIANYLFCFFALYNIIMQI